MRSPPPGSARVYLKMFDIFQTAPIRTSVTMAEHVFQSTIRQTTTVTVPLAGMETVVNLLVRNLCLWFSKKLMFMVCKKSPRTSSLCSHIFLVLRDHGVYMYVVYI